jgi:hypothetical protein
MIMRERRYSKYKAVDVWATLYEQQHNLDAIVHNGTVTGNCVSLSRPSKGVTYKAVILARASDWYKYSLNCQDRWKHGITAIVCGTHDSCVPVPVPALDQLKWYEPLAMRVASIAPLSFDKQGYVNDRFDEFRRGLYGHNMLIGALMAGREDATIRLACMRESTRLRIETKLKRLHQRRSGAPIEV